MKSIEKLFLVDDDDVFIYLTKKIIAQTNLVEEVKTFGHGKLAIDFITENLNSPEMLPNVIFLDLSMPVMDGWQFLDEFKLVKSKINKEIAIYILSSSLSSQDTDRAREISEVSGYISKPITKEKLSELFN